MPSWETMIDSFYFCLDMAMQNIKKNIPYAKWSYEPQTLDNKMYF